MKLDISDFIHRQIKDWPLAGKNFNALNEVITKDLLIDQCKIDGLLNSKLHVRAQYNPARSVSSGARVDPESISKRPCFLCKNTRNPLQEGISLKLGRDCTSYEILLNPFPIFPDHLTIVATDHIPQSLSGRLEDMSDLTNLLSGYTVFFNGAGCGASAPDHHHFQAAPSCNFVAWEWDIDVINSKPDLYGDTSMVNVLMRKNTDLFECIVFERKAHRPSFFAYEGDEGFMMTPGTVDISGVFIFPRKQDYDRIDSSRLRQVYDEVLYRVRKYRWK